MQQSNRNRNRAHTTLSISTLLLLAAHLAALAMLSGCSFLSGKDTEPKIVITEQKSTELRPITCKPWPLSTKQVLSDIKPESTPDGWLFAQEDYMHLSNAVDTGITTQAQFHTIIRHFLDCIVDYNIYIRGVHDVHDVHDVQSGKTKLGAGE